MLYDKSRLTFKIKTNIIFNPASMKNRNTRFIFHSPKVDLKYPNLIRGFCLTKDTSKGRERSSWQHSGSEHTPKQTVRGVWDQGGRTCRGTKEQSGIRAKEIWSMNCLLNSIVSVAVCSYDSCPLQSVYQVISIPSIPNKAHTNVRKRV